MKIRSKFLIILILISIVPIIVIGGIFTVITEKEIIDDVKNDLTVISNLMESRIEDNVENEIEMLQLFSSRNWVRELLFTYQADENSEDFDNLQAILNTAVNSPPYPLEILILDMNGKVISSSNEDKIGETFQGELFFKNAQNGIQMINFESDNNEFKIKLSGPLYLKDDLIGVVVMYDDPQNIILSQEYATIGKTGEILIAKKNENGDAKFLHKLRFQDSGGFITISKDHLEIPINHALNNNERFFTNLPDYRNEPVFSATQFIENGELGLVVKIDKSEALEPLNTQYYLIILSSSAVAIIVVIISLILSNTITHPIRKLSKATKEITKGNLSYDVSVFGSDEIRDLSKNISHMVSDIDKSIMKLKNFKSALDQSSIVAITDLAGTITYVNDKFCEVSKYSRVELIGQNHRILKSGYHSAEFYKNMWNTISSGKIWKGVIKNKAKDNSFYWLHSTIIPFFDDEGKINEYLAIRIDVTEQKELTAKLVKTERMTTIGHLASRMAHDIRNPLSIIRISLDNLMMMYGTDEKKQKQYEKINRSIDRVSHQIDDVLDYVKEKPTEMNKTKLSKIIQNSVDSIIIPNTITLVSPKNNVEFLCDLEQISVVLNNLILNGIQSIDGVGMVEISCEENKDTVIIQVKDSGTGIPKENLDKVFEPLFTTKQHGIGLGLSGVKSIIDAHKGTISVTSPPTIFTITLPKRADQYL